MSNKTYEDYFKVKMCHFIDYSDLIRIIREVFGFPEYDVLEEIEDNHQSYYEIEIYPEKQDINHLKSISTRPGIFLNEMCFRGLIPKGTYFIEVYY